MDFQLFCIRPKNPKCAIGNELLGQSISEYICDFPLTIHWGNSNVELTWAFFAQVIYFTALYPYLMLTILFFIGVTADGAEHGLEYLFDPDWSKLGDFRVWQAASEQVRILCLFFAQQSAAFLDKVES